MPGDAAGWRLMLHAKRGLLASRPRRSNHASCPAVRALDDQIVRCRQVACRALVAEPELVEFGTNVSVCLDQCIVASTLAVPTPAARLVVVGATVLSATGCSKCILEITTTDPLPDGAVGHAYFVQMEVSSDGCAYMWGGELRTACRPA
jgi:hypothetical protein